MFYWWMYSIQYHETEHLKVHRRNFFFPTYFFILESWKGQCFPWKSELVLSGKVWKMLKCEQKLEFSDCYRFTNWLTSSTWAWPVVLPHSLCTLTYLLVTSVANIYHKVTLLCVTEVMQFDGDKKCLAIFIHYCGINRLTMTYPGLIVKWLKSEEKWLAPSPLSDWQYWYSDVCVMHIVFVGDPPLTG